MSVKPSPSNLEEGDEVNKIKLIKLIFFLKLNIKSIELWM